MQFPSYKRPFAIALAFTCLASVHQTHAQSNPSQGASFWLAESESLQSTSQPVEFAEVFESQANYANVQEDAEVSNELTSTTNAVQPVACDTCCNPAASSCDDGCCDNCCSSCCCCPPWWAHRSSVFAEFLYLQPTDADVTHAQQQNGIGGAGTVPFGQIGVISPDYEPGIRVGGSHCLSNCSSIFGSYTFFESRADDSLAAPVIAGGGGAVGSLVQHPGAGLTASAGPVNATYDIDFQLAEVGLRRVWRSGPCQVINWSVGARYGHLAQDFSQSGVFGGGLGGQINTRTDINFDGGGLLFGLDGRRRFGCNGVSGYAKINVSPMTGRFHANYSMQNASTATQLALANWQDDRITTLLNYEAGLSWTGGTCDCIRLSAGYTVFNWFNAVTTDEFINGVQANNYVDINGPLSFSGFVTRAEFRW